MYVLGCIEVQLNLHHCQCLEKSVETAAEVGGCHSRDDEMGIGSSEGGVFHSDGETAHEARASNAKSFHSESAVFDGIHHP